MLNPSIIFLGGLVIITVGAEFVLRGAKRIAALLGIKPFIIGLTVVSIGTSIPELAVGIRAVSDGDGSLAIANIAGTNIFNILFILGLSATIRTLPLYLQSIKLDIPSTILTSLALILMASDQVLSRIEGGILIFAGVIYTVILVQFTKREGAKMKKEFAEEFSPQVLLKKNGWVAWGLNIAILIVGIFLTIIGANLLVTGAESIAQKLGVSDAIIGLTIVAIGTSAPELATTIVATMKDDRDVAIGNLIGSSIYNILVILGITCVASPNGVDVSRDVLCLDLPLTAVVALVCYPVFRSDSMVSRKEGIIFVTAYFVYLMTLLFLRT